MPQYCYRCNTCGKVFTEFRTVKNRNLPTPCDCHKPTNPGILERDILVEHSAVRGDYNKPLVAQSMSFDAIDVAEHRKRFPGVEVRTEGRIATPVFKSLSQKRGYLKKRKWVDCNAYF